MTFKGKFEPRPQRVITGTIGPRATAPSIGIAAALAVLNEPSRSTMARVPSSPHADDAKGRRIRESARGEDCDIRIPGACNFDAATTIWSHYPGLAGGRGMGYKSLDLCGVYSCSKCHDVVDMRAPLPPGETRQSVMLAWHEGHLRSLVKLRTKSLV